MAITGKYVAQANECAEENLRDERKRVQKSKARPAIKVSPPVEVSMAALRAQTPAWKDVLGAILPSEPAVAVIVAHELSSLAKDLGSFLSSDRLLAAAEQRCPPSVNAEPAAGAASAGAVSAAAAVQPTAVTKDIATAATAGASEHLDPIAPIAHTTASAAGGRWIDLDARHHLEAEMKAVGATSDSQAYSQAAEHKRNAMALFAVRSPVANASAPSAATILGPCEGEGTPLGPGARGGSGGRRSRTRLREAEEELTLAIGVAPVAPPTLWEFRSLVRERQRDFSAALDDAHKARDAADQILLRSRQVGVQDRADGADSSCARTRARRVPTLVREARALSGLGQLDDSCRAFLAALDASPGDDDLLRRFRSTLPHLQRARGYHKAERREKEERILDSGPSSGKGRPPGCVSGLRLAKPDDADDKWSISWAEPEDSGTDAIFEYRCELRHENPLEAGSMTAYRRLYAGRARHFELDCSQTFKLLLPKTPVELRVCARNAAGCGPWAALQDATDEDGPRQLVARAPPDDWRVIDISDLLSTYERTYQVPAREQFEACYEVWAQHVTTLKVVFRFACLQGASPSPHEMTYDGLLALVKTCDILSTKELPKTRLELIFVRANINKVDDDERNDRPDSLLQLSEFVGCVTRMASERLPSLASSGGLAGQTSEFIARFLEPQLRALLADHFGEVTLTSRQVQLVLLRHHPRLAVIFAAFAGLEQRQQVAGSGGGRSVAVKGGNAQAAARAAAAVAAAVASDTGEDGTDGLAMNLETWGRFLKEGGMLSNDFTQREATHIFVRANLFDELYAGDVPDNSDMTVTMEEFRQMVARLAHEKVPNATTPFHETLDSFITLIFVPAYRTALKKRGIAVPYAPSEVD